MLMNKREEILRQIKGFKEESASSFLLMLISVDVVFIAAYYLHVHSSIFEIYLFSLTIDRSYPEIYQYIKEFWVVLLTFSVFIKTKEKGYISWGILFTYMLFDDAFSIHEKVGSLFAKNSNLTPVLGLDLQNIGEVAITASSTLLLLVLIGIFYIRGSSKFKETTQDLLILLFVIAFFGVFIDLLHASVDLGWRANFILDVLEDGGEMIAVSLAAWYVFLLNARKGVANFSITKLMQVVLAKKIP